MTTASDVDSDRILALARRILASLPVEDPAVVAARRADLIAERYGEVCDIRPQGRIVRGPGGVARWVA